MGRYKQALKVIRRNLPYAAVCGRVCHHPCEQNCRRRHVDEGLSIRELKRYVAEHPLESDLAVRKVTQNKERIAIIGAGPSGMSAALDLARNGYRPCIYEKENAAGGIPVHAIPEYRLPLTSLERDIQWILDHGIELKTGKNIGSDTTINDLRREGYAAVVIAAGLSRSRKLPIPGSDSPRVYGVLEFLKAVSSGKNIDMGNNVLVIGGGNVACDAARSAVRFGCRRVRMLCLEDEIEMPAWKEEIEEAGEEGIEILHRRGPLEIITDNDGNVSGLRHRKVTAVFDEKGRFKPLFDNNDVTESTCDTVIFAIGQAVDPGFIKDSPLELNKDNRLPFDPETRQTDVDWIFACGEVVAPPGSVVEACASGQKTANAVIQYLETGEIAPDKTLREPIGRISPETAEIIPKRKRVKARIKAPIKRIGNFKPYLKTLAEREAVCEARRCMECGTGAEIIADNCVNCLSCVRLCPYDAARPDLNGPVIIEPEQCQACGICSGSCPARAIRMQSREPTMAASSVNSIIANLDNPDKPKIVAYICARGMSAARCSGKNSLAIDNCAEIYLQNPAILDGIQILRTLEAGAHAVFIAAYDETTEYHHGTFRRLQKKVARLREDIEAIGLQADQIQLFPLEDQSGAQIRELLRQGINRLDFKNV